MLISVIIFRIPVQREGGRGKVLFSLVLLAKGWRGRRNSSRGEDRVERGGRAHPILTNLDRKYHHDGMYDRK